MYEDDPNALIPTSVNDLSTRASDDAAQSASNIDDILNENAAANEADGIGGQSTESASSSGGETTGGFYNPNDGEAVSPSKLDGAEEAGAGAGGIGGTAVAEGASPEASAVNGLYNPAKDIGGVAGKLADIGNASPAGRFSKLLTRSLTKKNSTIGGIVGLLIGGGFLFGSLSLGPPELIHYAQTLGKPAEHQQTASTSEVGKLIRWAKTKDIGETRLGFLGSKLNKKIVADFADRGITVTPDPKTGQFQKFTIETENSKYAGMNPDEAKAAIAADNGIDPARITKGVSLVRGSTSYTVDVSDIKTSAKRNIIGGFVDDQSLGKISSFARFRTLTKRLGLPNWLHPLRKLALKTDQKIADKITAKQAKAQADGDEKSRLGKLLTPSDEMKAKITEFRDKTSGIGKGVGGTLIATAVLCSVKEIAHAVPEINRLNVVVPAMKSAGDALAIGGQIMAGQDVSEQDVGAVVDNFTDSKGGTPWQSAGIQHLEGVTNPSGGAVSSTLGQAFSPSTTAASLEKGLDAFGVGYFCSTVGQFTQAVVGGALLLTGVGGLASKSLQIATSVAAGYAIGDIVQGITKALTDDPLGGIPHQGIAGGNADALGAVEVANSANRGDGGTQLSQGQTDELAYQQNLDDNAQFQSESFASRMFDTKDYRSLAGRLIDTQNPNVGQNVANTLGNLSTGFMRIGSSLGSMFGALLPHAQAAQPSNGVSGLGIPEYGFSLEDLNNPLVANPYDNAQYVATNILDTSAKDTYVKRVQDCFGDDIQKDSAGNWMVTTVDKPDSESVSGEGGVNPNSEDYINANCNQSSQSDPNWLRIRFFIFDTNTMEGYACDQLNDTEACTNDGFDSSANTASTSSTPVTGGSAAQIATRLLSDSNLTGNPGVTQDLTATSQGQTITNSDTCGKTISINGNLLQAILTATTKYKLFLDNIVTGHGCDQFLHPKGRASDLGGVTDLSTGTSTNFTPGTSGDNQQLDHDFYVYMASILPSGSEMGQNECTGRTDITAPQGITFFSDTCTHQHIDLGDQ